MANGASGSSGDDGFRHWIALSITAFSILAVSTLGIVAIRKVSDSMTVLAAILPVIGTWIGTVLAFYFGKDNFETAGRAASALVSQLTPQQRLQSKAVTDVWIPKSSMYFEVGPPANVVLAPARTKLMNAGKGERIPVLDTADKPLLVVHLSTIDKYLADEALKGTTNLTQLKLQDMLDNDPAIKASLATSFGTVGQNATLEDAKTVMDALPECQDVFVTKGGTRTEPVLGWITNNIIDDNAKV